jgi:hypothetical protein
MAKCDWCHKEMTSEKIKSCSENMTVTFPSGEVLAAIPYNRDSGGRCHDCNVAPGGYHHPGCDMERCPKCNRQLISCGCLDDESESDDE